MECAIRTDDAMVSRKHSLIRFDQGRYWVEDQGSSNGTHVNDVRVQRQALNHNDVVRCGSLWLRYVEEGQMFAGAAPGGMGPGMGMGGAPKTQMLPGAMSPPGPSAPAPPQNFGFESTVATPRMPTQGLAQGGLGGALSPPSYGGGAGGVHVDMGMGSMDSGEARRYRQMSEELRAQVDIIRSDKDKEVAENKRLRAEHSNISQRLDDAKTQMKETEEVIESLKRVAEELRAENEQLKDRDGRFATQLAETQEDLASRTRQLQRANDDVAKIKSEIDTYKKQTLELTRMKDEGFKKLNEQLAEVEHLREVIREQERMIEERRVGLISLEEAMKDLRGEREARVKELATLKGERDEVRIGFNRQHAALQATEEENRRLGRLMQELQAGGAEREVSRLSADLRESRSEEQRLSSEVERLEKELVSAEQRVERMQRQLDQLEEAQTAAAASGNEGLHAAEEAKIKAEEARVRAESARMTAEQEKAQALKERDEAMAENAALKKRLDEAKSAERSTGSRKAVSVGDDSALEDLRTSLQAAEHKAAAAQKRYEEAEDRARALEGQISTSRRTASQAAVGDGLALRERAGEVYNSINDVLSELRVNISVVREEVDHLVGKNSDARSRTIRDAIEAAAGQTEDVKGVLRALREMSEG
jgi:chromosome segregation ATPase